MIRLTLVALGTTDGENWRVPVGRGSVTAFAVRDGAVDVAAPPAGGAPDEPGSGPAGSQA
jgi:hypothetical protein